MVQHSSITATNGAVHRVVETLWGRYGMVWYGMVYEIQNGEVNAGVWNSTVRLGVSYGRDCYIKV